MLHFVNNNVIHYNNGSLAGYISHAQSMFILFLSIHLLDTSD